jgi:tetratricopeptide (TPR) repeat protein
LMRATAAGLVAENHRPAVFGLAWQCRQFGDQSLADDLFQQALAGVSEQNRPATILAAIEYLWQVGQTARAVSMLQPLLTEPVFSGNATLWRLAALLAGQQGTGWENIPYLEKALDVEYHDLPEIINLEAVRNDYAGLFAQYQGLAGAMNTLKVSPPADFVARVLRMADRWRSLDPAGTQACQAAARVLKTLGQNELAWDYLTTPIGLQPNQASPWLTMAQTLREEGSYLLADRAFVQAFAAEPTNAQILWERAMTLQQAGRNPEAKKLFQQLADTQWQPRFSWIQAQARRQLGM